MIKLKTILIFFLQCNTFYKIFQYQKNKLCLIEQKCNRNKSQMLYEYK